MKIPFGLHSDMMGKGASGEGHILIFCVRVFSKRKWLVVEVVELTLRGEQSTTTDPVPLGGPLGSLIGSIKCNSIELIRERKRKNMDKKVSILFFETNK